MVRTKHSSPTEFAYPVHRICGKISRHSQVVHSCTASGKQITYLQGTRDLSAHPVTNGELTAHSLFARRSAAASQRLDHQSSTFEADMAAYRTARLAASTPAERAATATFKSYIWSLVKAEITA